MLKNLAQILDRVFKLGTCIGVPLEIHSTLILLLASLLIFNFSLAIVLISVYFVVFLHEYGHVFAAKVLGYKTERVELNPLGGVAYMDIPNRPWHELLIAVSGPLVNVLLIPILSLLAKQHPICFLVFCINISILFFNLIPVFPMDGGRILRATLQIISGKRRFSTIIAVRIAQVICCLFIIYGLSQGQFILILIGLMVFSAAESELYTLEAESSTICDSKLHAELLISYYNCVKCEQESVCVDGSIKMMQIIEKRLQELFRKDEKAMLRLLNDLNN